MTYKSVAVCALLWPVAALADSSQVLSAGSGFSFDTGAVTASGDILFTGSQIQYVGSAKGLDLGNIGQSGYNGVSQSELTELQSAGRTNPIALSILSPGNVFGLVTNRGNFAKAIITASSNSSITFQFTTFTASASGTSGPAIGANGVVNAASFADPRIPNGSIAQGSIFNVFGTGLGPTSIVAATSLPLQTTLGGTAISVTVNGTTVQCYMIYTLATQIAAILPSNTPTGTGKITVSFNGTPGASAPITVVKSSLGIFTVNQQGTGIGVIVDGNYKPSSSSFAFQPGEEVVAWGTGLGPINGSDATTPPSGNLPGISVTVMVGGINVTPLYAGRTGFAGEDQINFTIPQGVTGCNVPVAINVTNGSSTVTSNYVTMAIDPTPTCTSQEIFPPGFQKALTSGSVRIGSVVLNHSVTTSATVSASGTLTTTQFNGDQVEAGFNKISANAYSFAGFDLPYGTCIIVNTPKLGTVTSSGLDAGPSININGNGPKHIAETTGVTGAYYNIIGGAAPVGGGAVQPPYFNPGTYTADNGNGGKDVGPFNVSVTVPAPFTWTSYSSIATSTISRATPFTVNWTGGDSTWDVYLNGSSTVSQTGPSVSFECRAHDTDQTLSVPASILQALPPSGATQQGSPLGSLTMLAEPARVGTAAVSGLDWFIYVYSVEYQTSMVTFQ